MEGFDHLLHWKLKRGSHPFPGPDGGTCINEAALVAAGFEYRPIQSVDQMPRCFSRPICDLAIVLNDTADDGERQLLLPFVTRLACADTPEVEKVRADYISLHLRCLYITGAAFGLMTVTFHQGLAILTEALAIGRQADPLGPDEVQTRMDAARAGESAITPAAAPGEPFLTEVKSWLTLKESEPAA